MTNALHLVARKQKKALTAEEGAARPIQMTLPDAEQIDNDSTESTGGLIAELWLRYLPQVVERLNVLERAAASAADASLTPQLQTEAAEIAHKLAGSLGMFGFAEGTLVARQLELQWESPQRDPECIAGITQALRRAVFPEKIAPSAVPSPTPNGVPLRA